MLARLKEHIYTVVERYKGKIYAWDVVNEAVSDNPDEFLRDSEWSRICAVDFTLSAFQYAHEADPNLNLFYNDYNATDRTKRKKIIKLIGIHQKAGVSIRGIGLQGHVSIYGPEEQEWREALEEYRALGMEKRLQRGN